MLTTYFKSSLSLARYRSRPAGPYWDDFSTWLEDQGYRRISVRRHIREAAHFADWAKAEGLSVQNYDRETPFVIRDIFASGLFFCRAPHAVAES
jgi:hypothetical protein